MESSALVQICIQGLRNFNPETSASDIRLQEILENNPQLNDSEETFIAEVFSGCVRYHKLLSVTVENFYLDEGKKMLKKDAYLYRVFAYLAMMRLNDLGYENFENFVLKEDTLKMFTFLRFLFDSPKLQSWLKNKWCKIYDQHFVESSVLPNLLDNLDEVHSLISRLNDKLQNKPPSKKVSVTTKPEPFKLTQVKPRSVPMPEPIPKVKTTNPIPPSIYKSPREETEIQKKKEGNRKKSEQMLETVRSMSANHIRTQKSTKTQERMNTIIREGEAQLKFDSYKAKPVPKTVKESTAPVKLNAATILREDALYAKREEEELQKIVGVLSGEGTDDDFQIWRRERDEELKREEAERVARNKMIGLLSYEEAMLAKQRLTENNKERVQRMKKEADEMLKVFLVSQLELEEETRERVLSIQESHQQTKAAQVRLTELKKKMVQEVREESRSLMKIAVEEAQREMERKMKIIQEIRAFDRTEIDTQRFVDLTATAGFGFLCEMSIAELRERLVLAKEKRELELEERRGDILAEKINYRKMLEQKMESISQNRELIGKEQARAQREKEKMKSPPRIQSTEIDSLQRKLEEKRAERMRMKTAQQMTLQGGPVKRTVNLEAEKRAMEERRWKELEQSRERIAKLSTKADKVTLMT